MQGTLKNPLYIRLHAGFTQWLGILNFEPTSPRDMPKMLTEFLLYLEAQNCDHPHDIQPDHLKKYLECLHERPSQTAAGAISLNYIRKHLQVIRKFSRYLMESGQPSFTVKLRIKGKSTNIKSILALAEISKLYDVVKDDIYGLRDRAMLALYYGCGLRKNEQVNGKPSSASFQNYCGFCRFVFIFTANMGQVLRITVGKADYTYRILNPEPLHAATTAIRVDLEGRTLTLIRQDRGWVPHEPAAEGLEEVAAAIGKAIALRYRI